MVDFKVGLAVFGTLLVLGLMMTGDQTIDVGETPDNGDSVDTTIPTSISELLDMFSETPEATNEVQAEIQATELDEKTIDINSANVTGQNMTEIETEQQQVQTETPLLLENMTGTASINPTEIEGNIAGYRSENIRISGNQQVTVETPLEEIRIDGNNGLDLELENATGRIETETETELSDSYLEIEAFEGDMIVYPGNHTIILDGKFYGITAGDATYGY